MYTYIYIHTIEITFQNDIVFLLFNKQFDFRVQINNVKNLWLHQYIRWIDFIVLVFTIPQFFFLSLIYICQK